MTEFLTTLEEFDLCEKLQFPHLLFYQKDIVSQKRLAFEILSKKEDEILLVTSYGFGHGGTLAGLSEKNIEYIAKNSPKDYKESLLKILKDQAMVREVFEVAKAMDEDLGRGATQNQERVRRVVQYIKDNRAVFEF